MLLNIFDLISIRVTPLHLLGYPRLPDFGTGNRDDLAFVPFVKVNVDFPVGLVEIKEDVNAAGSTKINGL